MIAGFRQTVILIDEYDKSLLQTMWKDEALNETYLTIFKSFFGVIKSADQYLRFVFLTRVTKFSKVSIFSDLNNLRDLSLLSDYSAVCGISQEELEVDFKPEITALAENNSLTYEEALSKLKQRYDGYLFARKGKTMYNPLPILFQSGYLTIKDYNDFSRLYRLGFPDDKVRYGFWINCCLLTLQ